MTDMQGFRRKGQIPLADEKWSGLAGNVRRVWDKSGNGYLCGIDVEGILEEVFHSAEFNDNSRLDIHLSGGGFAEGAD